MFSENSFKMQTILAFSELHKGYRSILLDAYIVSFDFISTAAGLNSLAAGFTSPGNAPIY